MKPALVILYNSFEYVYLFRLDLARELVSRGKKVVIVAPKDHFMTRLQDQDLECIPIEMKPNSISPGADFRYMIQLYKILSKVKPELVLSYTIKPNLFGSMVCALASIPNIATMAGLGSAFSKVNLTQKIVKALFKVAYWKTPKVVFQNSDDARLFLDSGIVKRNQVQLTNGSGVDLTKFAYVTPKFSNQREVLFIGRLLTEKGIFILSQAAKSLPSNSRVKINVLGRACDSLERGATVEFMQSLESENFSYLGTTDDVKPFIERCNAVVLPSFYREGVPRSLIEGLAIGRAVITTDSVGCREVYNGKNGFLIQPRSVDSLTQALLDFSELPDNVILEQCKSSRSFAEERFDIQVVNSIYINLIESILNQE